MKLTPEGAKDICKLCGAEIICDAECGFWDSFEKEVEGVKYYTPWCNGNFNGSPYHEPVNHYRDEKGFYYVKEDEKHDDNRADTKNKKEEHNNS